MRVAVIHHHPVIRLGVAALLSRSPGIELVPPGDIAEADVLIVAAQSPPDAVAAGRIPVLTIGDDAFAGLWPGALGHISTAASYEELVTAVWAVSAGQPYPFAAPARRPAPVPEADRAAVPDAPLSPRERQVLALIAQGLTHHQAARRMGIAKATVDTYIERIRGKLRLGNKAELTLASIRPGRTG